MVSSLFALLGYPRSFCEFHNTKTSCCFFAVISYDYPFCLLLFWIILDEKLNFLEFFLSSLSFLFLKNQILLAKPRAGSL